VLSLYFNYVALMKNRKFKAVFTISYIWNRDFIFIGTIIAS